MKIFAKLDIKKIQDMNLFEKTIHIKPKYCIEYNSILIFTVKKNDVTKAIGKDAINVKKLASKLNRRVKIVATPQSIKDLEKFIQVIIYPHQFKKLFLENNQLTILTASKDKAALIGRGKTRLIQLSKILLMLFDIKKVIIK